MAAAECDLLGIPLSLQDTCMLHLVIRVGDFPVQSLALLPREIRRKLLFGLTHADVLHLSGTTLFDDVDPNRDYPHVSYARQCLLDVIMSGCGHTFFLSLHLRKVLQWFSREEYRYNYRAESNLFEHICKCYSSLEPTKIRHSYNDYFLFPKRSLAFVQLQWEKDMFLQQPVEYCNPVVLPSPLLNYCNMQSAPTELKIDCHNFKSTTFWKEFDKAVETTYTASRDDYGNAIEGANSKVDLVIPFVQEFLSSVEVLELGTDITPRDVDGLEEDMHTVPYVLLYNILSNSQPHLKHLKVYGIPVLACSVLETLVELLHATCTPAESTFTVYRNVEVLSPLTTPYLLEGISVLPMEPGMGYGFEYMLTSYASSISCDVISIVEIHKEKLKSVTVDDLGYCYDFDNLNVRDLDERSYVRGKRNINVSSYRTLLLSFVQFVKQPQFTHLNVGKSPLPEAYELIKVFLFTPAVHEQSLTIEASSERSVPTMEELEEEDEEEEEGEEEEENENDDEKNEDMAMEEETIETDSTLEEESRKRQLKTEPSEIPSKKIMKPDSPLESSSFPDQPLPETNAQYKCLDLGLSSSCVYSWLFTLPELKLKKLRMRTQDMTIVPADMVIQVEHVAFTTETHFYTSYKPTISPAHLEKFVVSNSAIKRLEFTEPTDECAPGLIPALNHCLSTLYQQGRGLEELVLKFVEFQTVELMNEFLIQVRNLSHRHGTTLVLSLNYYLLINSGGEESNLFGNLAKQFQEKKIKKIVCTMENEHRDPSAYLSLIAEVVDVHYRRPSSEM